MQNNQLTELPDSMVALTKLQRLVADYNQITTLPAGMGAWKSLQNLEIRNNALTSIPAGIGLLTGLITLQVGDNSITSLPSEIENLTALEYLYIYNNQIDELSEEIGSLTSLRFLYAYGNQMTGTVPASFSALTLLNRFYIQNNYLNRDENHNAVISASLNTRFTRPGMVSNIYGQQDKTAPVLSGTGTVPLIVAFFFTQQLTVQENSYAVNTNGVGMRVGFTGDAICNNLNSSPIMINSGTITMSIQSTFE